MSATSLRKLNEMNRDDFVRICGRFFEHSPWIAERTWNRRPFTTREALHHAMCDTLAIATTDEKVGLIAAHPDLVGNAALAGTLTSESTAEQRAAGLGSLSAEEISQFSQFNSQYRKQFGFPFVICARENKKDAILSAFPIRLAHSREAEIAAALVEIEKIARLRLFDAISEP